MTWILVAALLLLVPVSVWAQSTQELYQKVLSVAGEYQRAHGEYVVAKNQHIQYNTGATRVAAINKTREVLRKRNSWQMAYVRHLRQVMAEATNVANYPQTVVYLDLEKEISDLETEESELNSANDFASLNLFSSVWEKHLELTDRLTSAAQLQISSTRLATLQDQFQVQLDLYSVRVATPSATQKISLDRISQNFTSSKNLVTEVNTALTNYKANWSNTSLGDKLKSSQKLLIESANLLVELTNQP